MGITEEDGLDLDNKLTTDVECSHRVGAQLNDYFETCLAATKTLFDKQQIVDFYMTGVMIHLAMLINERVNEDERPNYKKALHDMIDAMPEEPK